MSTRSKLSDLPIVILFLVLFIAFCLELVSAIDHTPVYKRGADTDKSVFVTSKD